MTEVPPTPQAEWYYMIGEQRFGPVAAPALSAMIQTGAINGTTMVWRQGMAQWAPAASVPELAFLFTGPVAYAPAQSDEAALGLNTAGLVLFIILLFMCIPLCWLPWVIDGLKAKNRRR